MKPNVEESTDIKCEDFKDKVKGEDSLEKVKHEEAKEKADSDQEMMNLENELYSLTHYADDEEELVAQMFATIKGSKLEAMMPPILKEIPLIDVQQLCLHELRGMSQRRILSIINGQEMSGSSSEESDDEKKPSKTHDDNEDSNTGRKSADDGEDLLTGKDLSELENVNESNLTALDILELEMRAKLIKTMLEKDGEDDKEDSVNGLFDPSIKIKEEPLSPERSRKEDETSPARSGSRHRSRYSRRRRRGRSDSRSYSSSSRSSYSSRSYSRSYSSRSRSYSSDRKRDVSASPESSKKEAKKKLTKKEFEERMKKAKMNRTYRKRKESEEDSGDRSKGKKGTKKKEEVSDPAKKEEPDKLSVTGDAVPEEDKPEQQEAEEGEEQKVEEGEVEEKEEGEIDSNEEGPYSPISRSSMSHSRSFSSFSSSYSSRSRSRSYSRSPRRRGRRSRRKSKKSKKYHRSRSRSLSVPKIPNWKPEDANNGLAAKPVASEVEKSESAKILPDKEERESVSFSIKKNNTDVKTNFDVSKEAQDVTQATEKGTKEVDENPEPDDEKKDDEKMEKEEEEEEELSYTPPPPSSKVMKVNEDGEMTEDFYKGADQLSFSEEEGECEDETEIENFLHDDTPVELINDGDATLRKSVNVISKNEPPLEEYGSLPDAGDDSTQDVLEPLPETEAEDSNHNLEIIGVIDPSGAQEENFDEDLGGGSSWSMRWLQSEKVQKVVSNSTLLSKVRKKIQAKGKGIVKEPSKAFPKHVVEIKPESPKVENRPQPAKPSIVIGSIEEYEKLIGIKVKAPTSLPQPKPQSKAVSQAVSLLDSGDEDDSEDDAIWSKIIKK